MTTIDRQTIQPLTDDWDWQLVRCVPGHGRRDFLPPRGRALERENRSNQLGQTDLLSLRRHQ